jgi:hypothetical protein
MTADLQVQGYDYRRLGHLAAEFTTVWGRLQALYLDANAGFALVRTQVEETQARVRSHVQGSELDSTQFQDTLSFTYDAVFSGEFCTSAIHKATQGDVKARNSPGGTNVVTIGQMCVVWFSDYWNEYLRAEVTKAMRLTTPIKHDLWGDLRLLRNAIVHNQGAGTSHLTRCRLIHWFKPGEPLSFTPAHMRAVFLGLLRYRNELHATQFEERRIAVGRRRKANS